VQQRVDDSSIEHDVAAHAHDLDVLADAERLVKMKSEPGHHVAEYALQREADTDARHADAATSGATWSQIVESNQYGEQHDTMRSTRTRSRAWAAHRAPFRR